MLHNRRISVPLQGGKDFFKHLAAQVYSYSSSCTMPVLNLALSFFNFPTNGIKSAGRDSPGWHRIPGLGRLVIYSSNRARLIFALYRLTIVVGSLVPSFASCSSRLFFGIFARQSPPSYIVATQIRGHTRSRLFSPLPTMVGALHFCRHPFFLRSSRVGSLGGLGPGLL